MQAHQIDIYDHIDNAEVLGAKAGLLTGPTLRITERQEVHAPWKEASQSQALYMSDFLESRARMVPAGFRGRGAEPLDR